MSYFKNGRDTAMWAINSAVMSEVHSAAYALTSQPLNQAMAQIIAAAVKAGFEEYHRQLYNEEDFEKDIELKS